MKKLTKMTHRTGRLALTVFIIMTGFIMMSMAAYANPADGGNLYRIFYLTS